MKKRKNLKNRRLFLVILIIVIVSAVLFYTIKKDRNLNTFEAFTKDIVVEVQKIFYKPINGFSNMIEEFTSLKEVKKENQILKSNVEKMEATEAENIELKQDRKSTRLNSSHAT